MTKQVFEEAPPTALGDSARQLEKQARQLAYDTRWHVKKELGGKVVNAPTLEKMLLIRLQKSTAAPNVKQRAKEMLVGKLNKKVVASEQANIKDMASFSVANSLYKVFVENLQSNQNISLDYLEELFDQDKTKYKVRVTDTSKGTSYVRFATRDKITDLRRKGLKVERTEHGDPREDEAKHGTQTASVLGGGKAKKDYDGDGKLESPAKEHAGAVHNAIQRKRGGVPDGQDTSSVKEDYIREINSSEITRRKITGAGVDNTSLIKVFPEDKFSSNDVVGSNIQQGTGQKQPMNSSYEMSGSSFIVEKSSNRTLELFSKIIAEESESKNQQQLFGLALSVKRGETPRTKVSAKVLKIVDTMSEKQIRDYAKTKHEGLPTHKEESETVCQKDPREIPTERELLKNKLRAALGVKNPVIMVAAGYEPEGEVLGEDEALRQVLAQYAPGTIMTGPKRPQRRKPPSREEIERIKTHASKTSQHLHSSPRD